nr:YjgN family protein [Microbulbifer sediminum]
MTGETVGRVSRESAITAFARFAGIDREKAAEIFTRGGAVVKRDVDRDTALTYQRKFESMGIGADISPVRSDALAGDTGPAVAEGAGLSSAAQRTPEAPAPAGNNSGTVGKRHVGFVFSGNGYEYFKIWIVNILLTVVTLGLYAPWAKVRNTQYFYGNTSLEDASFVFTADPMRMLIGRLIALGLLAVFIIAGTFAPPIYFLMTIALIFVFPWVITKSLAFFARNTTYRNIRFRFVGSYKRALVTFIGWPLLASLTLGLLSPYALYKQQRFYAENHRYGNKSFNFTARPGDYYVLCVIALLIGIAGGLVGAVLLPVIANFVLPGDVATGIAAGIGGALLGYGLGLIYFMTGMQNLLMNHLTLSSHDFKANYQLSSYGLLMFTNFLFTLLTLGLFIPWAKVRLAHYAAEHTSMDVAGDLDKFAAVSQPDESAFGEEFGDVFDMDVAF